MKKYFLRTVAFFAVFVIMLCGLSVSAAKYETPQDAISAVPEGNKNLFPSNCSVFGTNGFGMESSSLSDRNFTNLNYKVDGTILYNAPTGLTFEDSFVMKFKMAILDRDNGEGGAYGQPESCSARIIFRAESLDTHLSITFFPKDVSVLYTSNNQYEGFSNTPFVIEEERTYDVTILSEPTTTYLWIDGKQIFVAENTPAMDISKVGVLLHFASFTMDDIEIYNLAKDSTETAEEIKQILPGNTLTGENNRKTSFGTLIAAMGCIIAFVASSTVLIVVCRKKGVKKIVESSGEAGDDFINKNNKKGEQKNEKIT